MKKFILVSFLIFVVFVVVVFKVVDKKAFYGTAGVSNIKQEFEIVPGEGSTEVGLKLEQRNLVENKNLFYYYVWKTDTNSKIQAGNYEISPNMTIGEMMEKFTAGKVKSEIVKLTIPEGFTNKKIIDLLEEKKPEVVAGFSEIVTCKCLNEKECKCDKFSDKYAFLKEIPQGVDMEGYLFPDTYFVGETDTAEKIVDKFLANFDNKLNDSMLIDINKRGKTVHEIVTLASIVEREVKKNEDRELVAGIFWQRLADKHPLQSCATLAYFLGVDKPKFSFEDTRKESLYNTYINPGLPPGPISNPGIASIISTIYPKESNFYYFLSNPETGKIIYSKTSEEHSINKAKYGL